MFSLWLKSWKSTTFWSHWKKIFSRIGLFLNTIKTSFRKFQKDSSCWAGARAAKLKEWSQLLETFWLSNSIQNTWRTMLWHMRRGWPMPTVSSTWVLILQFLKKTKRIIFEPVLKFANASQNFWLDTHYYIFILFSEPLIPHLISSY